MNKVDCLFCKRILTFFSQRFNSTVKHFKCHRCQVTYSLESSSSEVGIIKLPELVLDSKAFEPLFYTQDYQFDISKRNYLEIDIFQIILSDSCYLDSIVIPDFDIKQLKLETLPDKIKMWNILN